MQVQLSEFSLRCEPNDRRARESKAQQVTEIEKAMATDLNILFLQFG